MNYPLPERPGTHGNFAGDLFGYDSPAQHNYETDPQGWRLAPVPEADIRDLQALDERTWDSAVTRLLLNRIWPGAGQKAVLVGQHLGTNGTYPKFFSTVSQEIRITREIGDARETNPGMVVAFQQMPAPDELDAFLARNSREAGFMKSWSVDGRVPYAVLLGDLPNQVEFGMLDGPSQVRSHTMLPPL